MEGKDPWRRKNFTLGLHAEISVRVVPKTRRFENELKMAGNKNKNCNLGPSSLFAAVNNYFSAELSQLSARGKAKRNGRPLLPWLATERPATIFAWFVPNTRIFLAKAVYMVLGSS